MDRRIVECARKLRSYRQEMTNALSAHYPDAVVGRPSRIQGERNVYDMTVYSDQIVNRYHLVELPEVKHVLDSAEKDGIHIVLFNSPKVAMTFLPETGYKIALTAGR